MTLPSPQSPHVVVIGYHSPLPLPINAPKILCFPSSIFNPRRSAGITGLQSAIYLQRAGYRVTIIAEHVPGDEAPHYTSPW